MSEMVDSIIRECSANGRLDEQLFIRAQRSITFESRREMRSSAELGSLLFHVERLDEVSSDYYFWDHTTLCFKQPLLELVNDRDSVLEIGPGPAATLSIMLSRRKQNLRVVCAEIHPGFVSSAKEAVRLNGVSIEIAESDMTENVDGQFDVVFMNPPYVTAGKLQEIGIPRDSGEGKAGYAGQDGGDVIRKFLTEAPKATKRDGLALLGVNTMHVEDRLVGRMIEDSSFRLRRRYYQPDQTEPDGPYSQVYVLEHRNEGDCP